MNAAWFGPVAVSQPVIRWSWIGDHLGEIRTALVQHLELTFIAVGVGFMLSALLAAVAIRFRVTYQPINAVTGIMYAIPSLALYCVYPATARSRCCTKSATSWLARYPN